MGYDPEGFEQSLFRPAKLHRFHIKDFYSKEWWPNFDGATISIGGQ